MTGTEAIYFLLGASVIVLLLTLLGRILLHYIGMHRVRQMRIEELENRKATTDNEKKSKETT